ncbi:sucrose-6-phosphate hydrolase [Vibrio maritimus]|uniref:Sucrose-6-phosphate hydrolase n=1 Tax=Vibrio maritimus TaxID=990268 RepID=A0A090T6P6_9VIBR|nr:sucrose-6-phosphate hydrolase [Vibrio maritimus]
MLSIPRELSVRDNKLIQTPLEDLKQLRSETHSVSGNINLASQSFELEFETDQEFTLELKNKEGNSLLFSMTEQEFKLDRSNNSHIYAEEYGLVRLAPRTVKQQTIRLFVDRSVIEIFINNGEHTMTSRFFINNMCQLLLSKNLLAKLYLLSPIEGLQQ